MCDRCASGERPTRPEHAARVGPRRHRGHCATRLATRLAHRPRAADDWSITPPTGRRCELCATLATFLRDPARRSHDWPLAEQSRRHVHHSIDVAELPVRHQTRRQGRPYTLVLTKTDALFTRERQQRERDVADLAWLDTNYPVSARTTKPAGRARGSEADVVGNPASSGPRSASPPGYLRRGSASAGLRTSHTELDGRSHSAGFVVVRFPPTRRPWSEER